MNSGSGNLEGPTETETEKNKDRWKEKGLRDISYFILAKHLPMPHLSLSFPYPTHVFIILLSVSREVQNHIHGNVRG